MASCRACDLKVLVTTVCGLLTVVTLGLSFWRIVVRTQRGNSFPPSTTPIKFCENGGSWENGRCICPEEWQGLRCTIANFCENSTYGSFTFARIPVGRYGPSLQTCDKDTSNAGNPIAIRLCSLSTYGNIELQAAKIGNCNENLETLEQQIDSIQTQSKNISTEALILTSDASKLTADNITSVAKVVGQIFNTSRKAESEAKKTAVTTVSQLLDASEDVFRTAAAADNEDTLATLIEQMEAYSLSLGNESVVEPNVAVQSVSFPSEGTVGPANVRFSVQKGASDSLVSALTAVNTNVDGLNPDEQTELQILLNTTKSNSTAYGFIVFQNNKLFQSKTFTASSNFSQKVVSSKIDENEQDESVSVEMVFRPKYNQREFQLHSYACVYWNFLTKDWDTHGCHKDRGTDGFLYCRCNHTTNFAVLMTFKKDYQYPESLDVFSKTGCVLSVTGLTLTIIFQIVTRKGRRASVTWVLVSLCTTMLIFNLLFIFGIENSNKNLKTSDSDNNDIDFDNNEMPQTDIIATPNCKCTGIAISLHYFLLATFTWSGLNAAQLYFLLIRTMKPLPQRFILFISLIGWGFPAAVTGITVGIIYSQNRNNPQWELAYRQEEICWLANPEDNGFIKSPLLWSFIMPVSIILLNNVIIFIIITIKVLWKTNQNLRSTKNVSFLRKIIGTLSIAVVFGLTWILAYFMLISNDDLRTVFSFIFCILNGTQGVQIFILYTICTKIFLSKFSEVLKSLSSVGRVKSLPSVTALRLRIRMYNMLRSLPVLHEHFRLLEPSIINQENDTI
ncbi:PREDICTED: probable G-protein coupled receptor 128 [Galeopterus variegatus]|uniref:Probable G-protein coupled receptor 128 n=1 Tax=Galeopterus variegatus TaxID=482537 RepID=A0ABM0QJM6_GALVR|nr:PREDICTED: probable G-protein coupled receptor 128 [Galeopterus variegatus]